MMRSIQYKAVLKKAIFAVGLLFMGATGASAQSVDLTAGPTTITLPDGNVVPMWGYTCAASSSAKCSLANPNPNGQWSPIVITVAPGPLTINLTNNLPPVASSTDGGVATSLMIVGQLGGGLGKAGKAEPSPDHSVPQGATWPIANPTPGPNDPQFTPPKQVDRVRSMATEVINGTKAALVWDNLKPGTYLIESATYPSIQVPMGLYGVLIVTTAPIIDNTVVPPAITTPGTAYPTSDPNVTINYDADVPIILSEIDAVQNNAVSQAVGTAGFSETKVWSALTGKCGDPNAVGVFGTCYPPAVNYDPRYYLVNGVAFNSAAPGNSTFNLPTVSAGKGVLVRFVNAGLRMHIPSIVGAQVIPSGKTAAVPGFALIAEDGNVLPGIPRLQNEVFLPAGKTYDVMLNPPQINTPGTYDNITYPVFDRQLSLSTNNVRDGGMHAYLALGTGSASGIFPTPTSAKAVDDSYILLSGKTLTVSDPSKGVIANDVGVYGVALLAPPAHGTVTLNQDGTFTYIPNTGTTSDSFTYVANGTSGPTAKVTLGACTGTCMGDPPVAMDDSFTSNIASRLQVGTPGVLANDSDPQGHPLTASAATNMVGGTAVLNADGSFTVAPATIPVAPATVTVSFQYTVTNSQGTPSDPTKPATVMVTFNGASNLKVNVVDGPSAQIGGSPVAINDYRWIIEEDRTFKIDPTTQTNNGSTPVPSLGTNFHTSYMPVVAAGCVGVVSCEAGQTLLDPKTTAHLPAVCDVGNGACRIPSDPTQAQQVPVDPSQVALDPNKRYYISILPGDAGNSFSAGAGAPVPIDPKNPSGPTRQFSIAQDCSSGPGGTDFTPGSGTCGHGMGGAPIPQKATSVTVLLQETPYPTAKVAVFVFEDDWPLNGEADSGGGVDTVANHESGLGGFEITLFDDAGGTGDPTGQMTYDMFNMPLSNSLAGTIDQRTGLDACPISISSTDGLVGRIITCPHLEADGTTQSPLEGQVVVANLMPGRYGVVASPAADRIAKGEEWLQTNTLDGQKAHDSFIKVGGPAYFQEFGPAGYHVAVGFANPKIINSRLAGVCPDPTACKSVVKGKVTGAHISRTPDQRIYSTGTNDAFAFTQCYISLGDADGMDFAFTKCNPDGTFEISGLPKEDVRLTIFDQWNDQIVDGLAVPARLTGGVTDLGNIPITQWHTNIYTQTYFDQNGNGVRDGNEPGLSLLPTNIRFRDGSYSNFNNTDLSGNAGFNEIFPLFNWYVVESDTTRYKQTGVHVTYDAGGAVDSTGNEANLASTVEPIPVPTDLRVPGAVYCSDADCSSEDRSKYPNGGGPGGSTGRIDPPWVTTEGWQGFIGSAEFVEFGKAPFALGENGGIHGEVIYASTRPFDDPALLIHTSWTPDVPGVTVNLYQESTAADGTQTLKLVDTTKTTSWDDWAQGFHSGPDKTTMIPNMNCPGQGDGTQDLFFYTLQDTIQWLNPVTPLPNHSQFKCYDGLHNFNQVQPAPYDGMYQFPSVTSRDPVTGNVAGSNCTICIANPANKNVAVTSITGISEAQQTVTATLSDAFQPTVGEFINVTGVGVSTITSISESGTGLATTVTVTLASNYPGAVNSSVVISGVAVSDYNGTFTVSAIISPNTIQYLLPNTALQPSAGGTATLSGYNGTFAVYAVPSATQIQYLTNVSGLPTLGAAGSIGVGGGAYPNILPVGKYVVEMIVPPGYELVKEEDKNILIGDNYIAPVTQQFGGLGSIFILPDQAEVAGQVNPNSPQNPTQNLGSITMPRHEGDTGSVETFWPCVGQLRIVPDYISLFPQSQEVSPFAGASRHLCDRKEVVLEDQSSVLAKFWVFSSTHVAAHFTGFILDDFSSEFDPFAPQFGEKFAVPNLPVSIKDFSGAEISRLYSDQWGQYNGLNYSTWEVNPPNPTGYAPTMMVACMNDPGPIPGPNGTMITDPRYNPAYSQFCYEIPYMPGQTQYMDTPVVPTAAFAEGYNPVDCAYPDATPAVSEVNGDGAGPWVSQAGNTITIKALGDNLVPNNAYSGPSATVAPFNQKFITRHYNFGAQPVTCPTGIGIACPNVTVGGVPLTNVSWDKDKITGTVGALTGAQSTCPIPQRNISNSPATCGELVITAGNGKKSIDAVTVTIGGKPPTYVEGPNAQNNAIQSKLDSATPGDLIIVKPGSYNEMLLMWKPVQLQGVGAASVTINANTHPSGRVDAWRRQVSCLFGLALDGGYVDNAPVSGPPHPYDPTGTYSCSAAMLRQVDAIPLEPLVGWDPTLNGNIAELLQEPTLMGAYEGAGITALAKGVQDVNGQTDPNCQANGVCTPLTNSDIDCATYPSNFKCNPSRIDGLTFSNSSQGGGGIFLHGWNHSMEIANNRVFANAGTLSGGITVGQPETADGAIVGTQEAAFLYNANVHIHNNSVTQNASYGDELNSTTPEAAGGVTFCTGSDYYRFDYNWVCGNLSAGDGGGFAHFGFSYNGNISNNSFLFNQAFNPTIPTHGGGLAILGAPPDGTFCETNQVVDQDCAPELSDGIGPGLVIDSNLILGNSAESGSGGGLRFQSVNGTDIQRNPTNPGMWYQITVTNNIIVNNVAGWDGGGVGLQDALNVNFINNTVASNDSTASAGVLFNTGGAANANVPPPGCTPQPDPNQPQNSSCQFAMAPTNPQPAGLSTAAHTSNLRAVISTTPLTCPVDHPKCNKISDPLLANDMFWQNRSFHIQVGGLGTGSKSQQNLVTLIPQLNQATAGTGACMTADANNVGVVYWDLGVEGDSGPGFTKSAYPMHPQYSILDDPGYDASNFLPTGAVVVSQYCNGARVPPENGGLGYDTPPGISDATLPNPVFNIQTAATVDEGNNWVNTTYGPLTLSHPVTQAQIGDYTLGSTSPAISKVPSTASTFKIAPKHDFFGNPRPDPGNPYALDIGAHEFQSPVPVITLTPASLSFPNQTVGTSAVSTVNVANAGPAGSVLYISSITLGGTNSGDFTLTPATNCPILGSGLAATASCTLSVTFKPSTIGARVAAITITDNGSSTGTQTISLSGTGVGARITAAPTSLTFVSNNTPQTITVTNTGNLALIISSITLGGANPGAFSVMPAPATNCPILGSGLAPNGTCSISVTYTSTATSKATLNIISNAFNAAPVITLSGSQPLAIVSPTSLAFGSVSVGATSAFQTLTLRNNQTSASLTNIGVVFNAPLRFSRSTTVPGTCGTTLAANLTCTINVVFRPTTTGQVNSSLDITVTGVTVSGGHVTLSGTGIGLQPTTRNFGTVPVGSTSGMQTFFLTNNGTTNITGITQGALGGTSPVNFSIIRLLSTCGPNGNGQILGFTTLTPGASCAVTVQFRPTSVGAKNATVSVTDSVGTQSSTLAGTGN